VTVLTEPEVRREFTRYYQNLLDTQKAPCMEKPVMTSNGRVRERECGEAGSDPHTAAPDGAAFPDAVSRPGSKPWLCVNTRSDEGARIRLTMRREGCEVFWPRYIERMPKKDDVIRQLFPGYMFVQLPKGMGATDLRRLPGVLGVVGVKDRGRPDPCDHVVADLLKRAKAIDLPIDETEDSIKPLGREDEDVKVRITAGRFAGLHGLLRADRGQARVNVLLDILGGQRIVEMGRELLERAE